MAPESEHDPKQKNLDQEVRDMISTLTSRLGSIQGRGGAHKSGTSSSQSQDNEEEQGMRVITLAGTNVGATMKGDMDDKGGLMVPDQEETSSYLVNSNFQAINNSIMLGGTYHTNDPGVHLDITEYVDHDKKPRNSRRGAHATRSDNLTETDTEQN